MGNGCTGEIELPKADGCIGLSPGIREGFKKIAPDKKVELVPNGCDLRSFVRVGGRSYNWRVYCQTDTVAVFTGAHGIANGLEAVLDMALELKNGAQRY